MTWEAIPILQVICIGSSMIGLVSSGFIMSVNCWYRLKGPILNPCDQLIVALAFSSISFSGTNCVYILLLILGPKTFSAVYTLYFLAFFSSYAIYSGFWLSGCLCLFFFLKLNNLNHGFLARIKMKTGTLVPRLILAVQFISISNALIYTYRYCDLYLSNFTDSRADRQKFDDTKPDVLIITLQSFNCFIPFLLITVTTIYIIVSLCKHAHRMHRNLEPGGVINLKAHQRASCTMTCILVLYIVVFALAMGFAFPDHFTILYWVYYIVFCSYAFVQSVILIKGNSKLLQSLKMLFKGKNLH
ncbi:hypothetical protein GDO86_008992 [Hymenochirus boettgeri]|uniref:Taste receptor type 2 n=1 Tax=Hymenochirus boettgeri TaxID=247094 RepID=A0A8T2JK02_9PIPI|nr:hypothetical protein GDO86_008992 [Hymenochirus boettgeri]